MNWQIGELAKRGLAAGLMVLLAFVLVFGAGTLLTGCGKDGGAGKTQYHCPMHPTVVADKPGTCPICGMDLVPIKEQHSTTPPLQSSAVPGRAAVSISPEARQRMGLKLGAVEKRKLAREIRTAARIVPDETRLYHVTVKLDGYVEKLFTATTGEFVKEGEPLLTIYSPMLVSAQQEYLNVLKDNAELAAAAKKRLQLWDITDEQIERLAKSGKPERVVTLFAPASGSIIQRDISAGHKVMAGEQLLVLADLSRVWADADIYQSDLPYVTTGMPVEVTLPYWPGKTFTGKVSFLSPTLDPVSRTLRARLEIPNPELLLKPEMFATARLQADLGEKVAVPTIAVLFTGTRAIAFREGEAHHLIPVELKLGARSGDWYEVIDGLKEGDQVVVSANFLVDSESSMKAALEALSGDASVGGHQH